MLLDPRKDASELMAVCARCGAIATQPLDAASSVAYLPRAPSAACRQS